MLAAILVARSSPHQHPEEPMAEGISSDDIALLARVLAKIDENFRDRMEKDELKSFKTLQELALKLQSDGDKGGKAQNRSPYDDAMKRATALLKTLTTRPKGVKSDDEKPAKVEWEVTQFVDEGHCADAASKSPGKVKSAYDRDKKKYMEKAITEGDLGCLYESNLTTEGDKYSLFFKYVRLSEGKAKMVAVAIGSHHGSTSKYVVISKDGKPTTTPISATKKL
jgi:hypothetical protein